MGYYLPEGATQIGSGPFYSDPNGNRSGTFNQPPNLGWALATDAAQGEVYQSRPIADNQLAIMYTRITATAAGQISFKVNVSSERSYDYFVLELAVASANSAVGSVRAGSPGDTVPDSVWTTLSLEVASPGTYELRFIYRKDGSTAAGRDNARVDDVVLSEGVAFALDDGGAAGEPGDNSGTPTGAAGAVYTLQYPLRGQCWPNPGNLVLVATPAESTEP